MRIICYKLYLIILNLCNYRKKKDYDKKLLDEYDDINRSEEENIYIDIYNNNCEKIYYKYDDILSNKIIKLSNGVYISNNENKIVDHINNINNLNNDNNLDDNNKYYLFKEDHV